MLEHTSKRICLLLTGDNTEENNVELFFIKNTSFFQL